MENVINELKSLDLSKVSNSQVIEVLRKFGQIGMFGVKVTKGSFVLRSRNSAEYEDFLNPSNISYISNPALIPQIGRANLDKKSVFYGSIPIQLEDQNINQIIAMAEASHILKIDSQYDIYEYATVGKWRVVKDFTVAAIVSHENYLSSNKHLRSMHETYCKYLDLFPDKSNAFRTISNFIAAEFAKDVENSQEYKISAAASEILYQAGAKGILYPSKGAEGSYFNLALLPEAVDLNLQYEIAGVWKLIKRGKNIVGYPIKHSIALNEEGNFIWTDAGIKVPPSFIESNL